ncbi:hypothetical protein ACX0G7_13730 [Flavitalea antarctica]
MILWWTGFLLRMMLIFFCAGVLQPLAVAQSVRSPLAFTDRGAGAFSENFTDVFCLANNPAASAGAEGFSAGIYSERRFMLKELSKYHLVIAHAATNGNIALKMNHSGFSGFSESSASLSYGRDLGKIRLGIGFNYHRISISGYGSASTYSADVALIWQLTEKLHAGIHAINPVPVFFGPGKTEQYASVYKMGMGYEISEKCFIAGELWKETGKIVNVMFALQYRFIASLGVRGGFNTDVGQPFAGVDWVFGSIRLGISGSYHPDLGFTPSLLVCFMKEKGK